MRHGFKALALVVLLAGPMSANAVVVNVGGAGGQNWDISTCTNTWTACTPAGLNTPRSTPWWDDQDKADSFALALQDNNVLFAYTYIPYTLEDSYGSRLVVSRAYSGGQSTLGVISGIDSINTWAFPTNLALPEPGTLTLLGLGLAGLGFARRRKAAGSSRCVRRETQV